MVALKGFINGNTVVTDGVLGNLYDGKEVIITILDTIRPKKKRQLLRQKTIPQMM